MSNADSINLTKTVNCLILLAEMKDRTSVSSEEREPVLRYLREHSSSLKKVQDALNLFMSIPEFNINKDTPIFALGFSVRVEMCLKRKLILTVGQLLENTEQELRKISGMGKFGLLQLKQVLDKHNLKLGTNL